MIRVPVVIIGGYGVTVGIVGLGGLLLPRLGMATSEAVLLASMLGFLIYLAAIIWGFAERRVSKIIAVLGVGSVATIGLAAWLSPVVL